MKLKMILTLLFSVVFISIAQRVQAQNKSFRGDKKNEIAWHFSNMWNNDFYSYGIGYERTVHKYKNNLKSFLYIQTTFFLRTGNFSENISSFVSSRNQIQSIVKYNFGYRKIFSFGLGAIIVGERFYPNPTGLLAYKYDLPKAKVTIGLQFQVSLNGRIPPTKFNAQLIPNSAGGFSKPVFDISKNWCGGISIGKYF